MNEPPHDASPARFVRHAIRRVIADNPDDEWLEWAKAWDLRESNALSQATAAMDKAERAARKILDESQKAYSQASSSPDYDEALWKEADRITARYDVMKAAEETAKAAAHSVSEDENERSKTRIIVKGALKWLEYAEDIRTRLNS